MKTVDIVVIGGGSAGLAAAISAYDQGIKNILVLEKEPYLGGILLQCIHNGFGLHHFKEELTGPEYAFRYTEELQKRNIDYRLNTMVMDISSDLTLHYANTEEGYVFIQAKAIICATGCSERTRGAINIPGDRPAGILTAGLAQKYMNIDGYQIGKKVFILGSGDIGLIMARRMRLEGADVLGVAEIMPYSNGLNRNLVQCLFDYQIPLYLSHTIKKIIGKTRVEKIVIAKVDEQFQFIEGTEETFEIDTLLLSVGLIPSNPILEKLGVNIHPRTKGPIVDDNLQTSIPGIFACGNSLHVHDLVDFVSEEGAQAGKAAALFVKNQLKTHPPLKVENGKGVSYVLPQYLKSRDTEQFEIRFRVNKPYQNVTLIVKQQNLVIKKMRKAFLFPAEMEVITGKFCDLMENGPVTVEVEDE
ncbi:MAG: FAD-dependent oxidoreductase [Bacilli bacterium]|nr:FAD-dependent oxidoreductase [Bacilli bacterium]